MEAKNQTIIKSLQSLAKELLPTGSRVALYGSRARGDYRVDSDWDIHIIIPGDNHITNLPLIPQVEALLQRIESIIYE